MNECDRCNRPSCANCPYTEPEKTLAERFADNLEISGDYAIEMLENADIDCIVRELIEDYWNTEKNEIKVWVIKEIKRRL